MPPVLSHAYLVLKFYSDGADIRYIDPKFLRQKIGLVSQEPVLFAATIAENIRYGMTRDVSQEEIEQAARFANAHQFITEQQDGYNTLVYILSNASQNEVLICCCNKGGRTRYPIEWRTEATNCNWYTPLVRLP